MTVLITLTAFVIAVLIALTGCAAIALLLLLACCIVAGSGSREKLKRCPVCKKIPKLGYCCGEYFVHGEDPDCLCCGTAFTEMHSSEEREIDAWNRRAKEYAIGYIRGKKNDEI